MGIKLVIKDEVNIKFVNLPLDARKKLVNSFKYKIPYARYQPAFKLGRWDGTVSLFGLGGDGYLNQLEEILSILGKMNLTIDEVEDLRVPVDLSFTEVTETYWADQGKVWPVGHELAGRPIILRDYQVNAVNCFISNPQSLQAIATGAGKTITTATLAHLCEGIGRTIIIVPNKSLVNQTLEDFVAVGLDVGVYFGDKKELHKTHTICTWQSLNILGKKSKNHEQSTLTLAEFLDGVKGVIVDECFEGNTLIHTPTGQVKIQDLRPGDKVVNFDEVSFLWKEDTIVDVHTNLTSSDSAEMLQLEFDNGIVIQVTANHKLLTTQGWVRADALTEEMQIINWGGHTQGSVDGKFR